MAGVEKNDVHFKLNRMKMPVFTNTN